MRHNSAPSWTDILDLKAIFWGAFWGLFFWVVPHIVIKWWRKLTPARQYLVMATLFLSTLMAGVGVVVWMLSGYLGITMASILVSFPFFALLKIKDEEGITLWEKITHKLLDVPLLWRDYVTRTCKKCRLYDSSTRNLALKQGWMSAYEPCRNCGSNDFVFHKLK